MLRMTSQKSAFICVNLWINIFKKFRENYEISPAIRRDGRIIIQTTFGLFVSSKIKVKNVKLRNPLKADELLRKRGAKYENSMPRCFTFSSV